MSRNYPMVTYPKEIDRELKKMQRSAKVIEIPAPPAALPQKPRFLQDAPWYATIIVLLAISAFIYQVASIPVFALLGGMMIALITKYLIDYPKWCKKIKAARRRAKTIGETRKVFVPKSYPDWRKIVKFETSATSSEAQVGVSEKFFLHHLQQHFPAAPGHEYPNDWGGDYNYSSDLEVVLAEKGLALQVEIDEPYEGKEGHPHHCCDNNKDAKRDDFFLKRGWVVIRFAEEQVVTQPQACCQFIARQIQQLTGDDQYLAAVGDAEELRSISSWTTQDARRLRKAEHRLKYLVPAGLWQKKSPRGSLNN